MTTPPSTPSAPFVVPAAGSERDRVLRAAAG